MQRSKERDSHMFTMELQWAYWKPLVAKAAAKSYETGILVRPWSSAETDAIQVCKARCAETWRRIVNVGLCFPLLCCLVWDPM